jgi:3-hydroxyacyl-[acyl-carrier-protein] dehydratase
MIDEAEEVIPGKSAKGFKYLDPNEWYFKVHWPSDPNMPGMLQIESLVQMSRIIITNSYQEIKESLVYIISAKQSSF